ncbi:unnamed protein product [Rotaria sp. Silwood1]|nr:unnamed protein product [Rotaria sp. Silwood1]CAF1347856.1 unnamed protein product [Rotaria sp. Silwood1]
MSEHCVIQTCKRVSRVLCHCCNQHFCREHFIEHDDLINFQTNPLFDEINRLDERLRRLDIDRIVGNVREKLDQWRIECHEKIDRFYKQKCQELDQYVEEKLDKQRKEINKLRSDIIELNDKQNINLLTSTLHTLKQNMDEIEQNHVQVNIRSLLIDNDIISIDNRNKHQFNLLALTSPYQTLKRSGISTNTLTSNDRFLLVHIDSNLCLINKELSIVKRKEWIYDRIEDMCWSSTLYCFVIITLNSIFLFNENTMQIESVENLSTHHWWSCACSNKSLYLSKHAFDSTIFQYSLIPSIQFVKQWHTVDTSKQKQRIDTIIYNNKTLCLMINDQTDQLKFIELRSSDTFNILWSLRLDLNYNNNAIGGCLFTHDEWLVVDWDTSCIFHIVNDGILKENAIYDFVPYNVNLFNSNILVVLTKGGIHFYKV